MYWTDPLVQKGIISVFIYDVSCKIKAVRNKVLTDTSKILYKTQAVFPPTEIAGQQGAAGSSSGKTAYTLPAGQHEYPFRFKVGGQRGFLIVIK